MLFQNKFILFNLAFVWFLYLAGPTASRTSSVLTYVSWKGHPLFKHIHWNYISAPSHNWPTKHTDPGAIFCALSFKVVYSSASVCFRIDFSDSLTAAYNSFLLSLGIFCLTHLTKPFDLSYALTVVGYLILPYKRITVLFSFHFWAFKDKNIFNKMPKLCACKSNANF